MPITLETPVQGDAIGPGTIIRASTFSVLPPGHHWDALVFEVGKSDLLVEAISFVEGQSVDFTLGVRQVQPSQLEPIYRRQPAVAASAGEFELHVRAISAQSTILDTSGPIGITWRPDPWGVAYVDSLQQGSVPAGGYAQTDRDRDIATNAAVMAAFPFTDLLSEVAEVGLEVFEPCPPFPLLVRDGGQLLFGDGTLTRPSGPTGVNAYGFSFRTEIVPPGLSVRNGVAPEYPERLAQFLLIRVDARGDEYVADRWEFHHDQERVCWGIPFPKRLEFSILPGVSLRFFWLLFPVGQ